jgi:hypothetical protein
MKTYRSIVFAAGTVLAGGLALGAASAAPSVAAESVAAAAYTHVAAPGARAAPARRAARARAATRIAILRDPALSAIASLRAIERVYRHEGREGELPGYLRGVLARTNDAAVRNYVNFRLARMEMRERDAKGALEALQRGLDENLARLQ